MKSFLFLEREDEELKRPLMMSLGFHAIIFLFLALGPTGFDVLPFIHRPDVNLLPAVRVDIVDLPQILKKDLQDIDLTQTAKDLSQGATPVEKSKEVEETKESIESFKEKPKLNTKIDQKKAVERMREELKRKQAIESLRTKKQDNLVIGGNVVSQGTALSGQQVREAHVYGGALYAHMMRRWNLPPWLKSKKIKAVLRMWIGPDGRLLKKEFEQPSGNSDFDAYVIKTAELSSPFPVPPDDLKSYLSVEGIGVNFEELKD